MRNAAHAALVLLLVVVNLTACGGGGGGGSGDEDDGSDPAAQSNPPNNPPPPPPPPPNTPPPTPPGSDPSPTTPPGSYPTPWDQTPPGWDTATGFTTVSDEEWDETAVRKVLQTFALGAQTTDEQIDEWAAMSPEAAIGQMLTFDHHNTRLSPVGPTDTDELDQRDGTLNGLSAFWTSNDPANGVPGERRESFEITNDLSQLWAKAATSRGLNPFRHRMGMWETNYHLSVNLDAGVNKQQISKYYDDILDAHASGAPYADVMTTAALSAAVATQYGHRTNRYRDGVCECNEDFGREYFQLFFGILGEYDPVYHETVDIKHMAAALTDMEVPIVDQQLQDYVIFGTDEHYPYTLELLNALNAGETALERVEMLSPITIEHPESLLNLPVMIVSSLADDAMTDEKATTIRKTWVDMPEKNLLDFVRAYAISTTFHDADRIKYWTSPERYLILANAVTLTNEEGDVDLYNVDGFEDDGLQIFKPIHNVFGSQTGKDAAESPDVFRNQLNRVMDDEWRYRRGELDTYGRHWVKDWSGLAPRTGGDYVVSDVAEWLWERIVADGLRNFGSLERAYVYALLATNSDFAMIADPDYPDHVYTSDELEGLQLAALVDDLGNETMSLDSANSDDRLEANERLGQAINFITGTPFVFVQEGR